jgi:hypothetical protein
MTNPSHRGPIRQEFLLPTSIELFERRFVTGADSEASVRLVESKERLFFVFETYRGAPSTAEATVAIPAALLPELKRAITDVERVLSDRGVLDDYESAQAYQQTRTLSFANESEREFARILDFYRIRWEYEPTTFPIAWDETGYVHESFTPDFYLPDYGLFIELTTMKQSLVTRKNRKLRLFKEHYPNIPIKLFYGKDYNALLAKYGLRPHGEGEERKSEEASPTRLPESDS